MAVAGVTHDLTIATIGGTAMGFMLWRDRNGKRGFSIRDAQTLRPRVLTMGELTQAEFPEELQATWYQEDWRGGLGGVTHRLDPLRYATATQIDASVRGRIRPAQERRVITVDSNPTGDEYVPSGVAVSGTSLWLFIGRTLYNLTFSSDQGVVTMGSVDNSTRIHRNGVQLGDVTYVPSWADDTVSGGTPDRPTRYLYKTSAAASFSQADGSGSTNREAFKYFAVAGENLWGGYTTQWADSTLDVEGGISIDAVYEYGSALWTTHAANYSAGTGSNRCLIVGVLIRDATPASVSTITYGGVGMTLIATATQDFVRVSVYQLVAPASGSNELSIALSEEATLASVIVYALSNVNQSAPIANSATATTNAGVSISAAPTSADNDLGIDFLLLDNDAAPTIGAGQTERASPDGTLFYGRSSVEEATGASVTLSWTWAGTGNQDAALVGITVAPVASPYASTITTLFTTGTPSGQFTANDVIRLNNEYMLVTAVTNADFAALGHARITVTRGYRGTGNDSQAFGSSIYEATNRIHHVHSTTDGTAPANWSTATAVGDANAEITGLVGVGADLIVLKQDGIFRLEADGTVTNLLPELSAARGANQFRGAIAWNDKVFLPLHDGGLWVLDTVTWTVRDISFSLSMPEQTQYHGKVVAMAGPLDYIYALVLDSTNTQYHLFKGQYLTLGESTDYRWHHVVTISYTTGTDENHACLFYDGMTSGSTDHARVWVGVESTGSNLLFYFYPHSSNDASWGYTNDSTPIVQFVEFDGNLPRVQKTFASIDVESAGLGAGGRQYTVSYRLDAGSWLTNLTDAAGNADGVVDVSPTQTLTFPAGSTGRVLEVRAAPAMTSVGTTPAEILSFRVNWQLRPSTLKTLPLRLYLADKQRLLNGALRGRPVLDLAQLETWDAQAAEVTVVDARRTSRSMVFLPGFLRVQEIAREFGHRPEYLVAALLAEV